MTGKAKLPRVKCVCLGCNRTTVDLSTPGRRYEWVCGKHWRAVPLNMRRRVTAYRRRAKRDTRWAALADRMWVRCRDRAFSEALTGIEM